LAQCKLDLTHPKFRVIGNASDADLQAGLSELQTKVAKDHKITGWFSQPMPKYPAYQNKIWQWDCAPEGDRSGTRKGWRLYAYIPNPNAAEPIPATAFVCWDKKNAPKGDYVKHLAGILKKFLAETIIQPEATPDRFRHQTHPDGRIISLCYGCSELILSATFEDAEIAESAHQCVIADMAAQENSN
jgi:hypothetical protein